jgi:hypothetical protein
MFPAEVLLYYVRCVAHLYTGQFYSAFFLTEGQQS